MDEVLTKIICFQDWYFWWPNKFSTFSISLILKPSWWSLKSLPCPSDEEGLRRQLYLQECWWFAYEAWLLWRLCTISSSLKTGFLERALDSFEGTWGTTLCLDFLIKMEAILIYGFESFMVCSISVHIGWSSEECLFVQGLNECLLSRDWISICCCFGNHRCSDSLDILWPHENFKNWTVLHRISFQNQGVQPNWDPPLAGS